MAGNISTASYFVNIILLTRTMKNNTKDIVFDNKKQGQKMTAKEYRQAARWADYIRLKAGGRYLRVSRAQALAWTEDVAAGKLFASKDESDNGRWLWLF